MSDAVFQKYSAYYDLLYHDKDYVAEADYVARTLQAAAVSARTVLEFGSGSGRHGRLLANRGFHVYGVERSGSMVTLARAAKPAVGATGSFDSIEGDIRSVDTGRMFDVVTALFHVVSYQTSNAELAQTFASAARHLQPGGLFLFDVWHGPAVLAERPAVRVKRVEDADIRLTRIAEPELNLQASVVTVRYSILAESKRDGRLTTFTEEHRMRYLFPTEIEFLAEQTGFACEHSEEFLTGREPSDTTWGVAYLLRKRA